MIFKKKKHNSQFIEGCNTDWNVNLELMYWINYWFKEYKEKAKIKLDYHKFKYRNETLTQEQIIDKIIELTNYVIENYGEFDFELCKKVEEVKDEIFDLLKLVWGVMWW